MQMFKQYTAFIMSLYTAGDWELWQVTEKENKYYEIYEFL